METGTKAQRGRDEQRRGQSGAGGGEAGEDGGGDGKGAGTGGGRAGGGTATGTATVKAAGTGRRRPGAAGQRGEPGSPPASPAPGPGPALTGAARRRTGCAAPGCAALHRDALRCGARRAAAPSVPFPSPRPRCRSRPGPRRPRRSPGPDRRFFRSGDTAKPRGRRAAASALPPGRAGTAPTRVRPSVRPAPLRAAPDADPQRGSAPRSPVGAEPGRPLGGLLSIPIRTGRWGRELSRAAAVRGGGRGEHFIP